MIESRIVRVTAEDIATPQEANGPITRTCPVAKALRRAFPEVASGVCVEGNGSILLGHLGFLKPNRRVSNFIWYYDRLTYPGWSHRIATWWYVRPFSFAAELDF